MSASLRTPPWRGFFSLRYGCHRVARIAYLAIGFSFLRHTEVATNVHQQTAVRLTAARPTAVRATVARATVPTNQRFARKARSQTKNTLRAARALGFLLLLGLFIFSGAN